MLKDGVTMLAFIASSKAWDTSAEYDKVEA